MSASRFGPPALHQPGPAPVHASVASVARIALGLLLALAALPCGTHANGTATAPHDGAKFRRQEPFVTRPFKPFIGDRWIGEAVAYGPHRDGQRPD